MRTRSAFVISTVVLTGLALLGPLPARAEQPSPHAARAVTPAAATPVKATSAAAAKVAVLPTGERVRLVGSKGRERVLVSQRAASGPGRAMITRRMGGHVYVFPAVAEPYLGRTLDPSLFDASRLPALQKTNRLPVRIAYTGSAPTVPGVTLTSAKAGSARGYLTNASSADFGRALARQWQRDARAGFGKSSTPFSRVTHISLDAQSAGKVSAKYVMYTLVIKTVGSDGLPQPLSFLSVLNVDDGRKYAGFVIGEDGEARISVPAGHYSIIGDEFLYDEAAEHGSLRVAVLNEYEVTGPGQTVTVDQRTATARPSYSVPRPARVTDYTVEIDRSDEPENYLFGSSYGVDDEFDVYLTPVPKPQLGDFAMIQDWSLDEAAAVPAYHYDLATIDDEIPAVLRSTFTAAELATRNAAYYGDGSTSPAGFVRIPVFGGGGGFYSYDRVARGHVRTEYVGAKGGDVLWADAALINYDAEDDPGFLDSDTRELPAGSTGGIDWFRGPLAAGIPIQTGGGGYCFACRYGNRIGLGVVPVTDSDPTHLGGLFGAEDGLPVARYRFYRGSKLVRDLDDRVGDATKVSAKRYRYRAVIDVNRRLTDPVQSTQSHTEYRFNSKKGAGKKLGKQWYCEGSGCRVLPLVQAKVALPTDLNGRLPAGKVPVTVSVSRIQGAAAAAASSAHLDVRPAGYPWLSVPLTANGDGTYRGEIDNTDLEGSLVDIRVRGADKADSTFDQTVLRAYSVAPA